MSYKSVSIVWLQSDLRLEDNPALNAAIEVGNPVIPIYIWDDTREYYKKMGEASRWWLHHSLVSLKSDLKDHGLTLQIFKESTLNVFECLGSEFENLRVFWNRRYEPNAVREDMQLKNELESRGIAVETFSSYALFEPDRIRNKTGGIYKVFTPFWKRCLEIINEIEVEPLVSVKSQNQFNNTLSRSVALEELSLLPTIGWDKGFYANWKVGEASAKEALERFIAESASDYKENRDIPALRGTSRLSPALHFGEISPRQIVSAVRGKKGIGSNKGSDCYLSEVGWREFAIHLLYHYPDLVKKPLRSEFEKFPWKRNSKDLEAWQKGMTGIPMVDAGMRELWHTGWMHNRVRMIVASFLVKNLQIHWLDGMEWFWDTLVDADLASNTLSWQWVAGCGADAAPYFRIFNPVTQGQKFDPDGDYIKKWIPELKAIPKKWVHCPWEADADLLNYLQLEDYYPNPIVDLKESRKIALQAYETIK